MHVFHQCRQFLAPERVPVGQEVTGLRHVFFGLLVEARVDGVVRALEQAVLAVRHDLQAVPVVLRRSATGDAFRRHHDGGGDVVLHLHLFRGDVVLAQLEGAPLALAVEADAQVGGDDVAAVQFQFVGRRAIDLVDRQVVAPGIAPLDAVETLDQENQRQDARRNRAQPGVVFVGVGRARRQQFDHRTEAAFGAQRLAGRVAVLVLEAGLEAPGVIPVENGLHLVEVFVQVVDEQRSVDHRVVE